MRTSKRNYFILLLLAALFAAPGITALLYYRNPHWLLSQTTNKGELLNPPVLFADTADSKAKWRFILWYPGHCEAECLGAADKLARVRLALGRRLYEVDQWLVLPQDSQPRADLMRILREQDIHHLDLAKDTLKDFPILGDKAKLFIANSKGFLVLSYPIDTEPAAVYHDIKQLLNTTEKNG